jgi:hypothetical protein
VTPAQVVTKLPSVGPYDQIPAQRIKAKLTRVIRGLIAACGGCALVRALELSFDSFLGRKPLAIGERPFPRDFLPGFSEVSNAATFVGLKPSGKPFANPFQSEVNRAIPETRKLGEATGQFKKRANIEAIFARGGLRLLGLHKLSHRRENQDSERSRQITASSIRTRQIAVAWAELHIPCHGKHSNAVLAGCAGAPWIGSANWPIRMSAGRELMK